MKEKYYFDKFPVLENNRLILREIKEEEAEDAIELAVYDGFFAKSKEDVVTILIKIQQDYIKGDSVAWGIYLKATNELTGTICFCRGYKSNIGEVGYVLKKAFRGLNIMTEACKLVKEYGLKEMGLSKIVAYTNHDNYH